MIEFIFLCGILAAIFFGVGVITFHLIREPKKTPPAPDQPLDPA